MEKNKKNKKYHFLKKNTLVQYKKNNIGYIRKMLFRQKER